MKRVLKGRGKFGVLAITLVLIGLSIVGMINVKTNYDMTEYLPEDSNTSQGIEILKEEFGMYATIQVMIEDISVNDAVFLKHQIQQLNHVNQVVWLDDVANISEGINGVEPSLLMKYYHNNHALFTVLLDIDDYSVEIDQAIDDIETVTSEYQVSIRGNALNNRESRTIAEGEVLKILLLILPICILLILVASKSWVEPIIILLVLGVGIIVNMGTNALLPNVSFITMTLAMALQLALSMDYSLFMIHRFYEEMDDGLTPSKAAHIALRKALPSISASALTTIMGFVALLFMKYRIGFDIGIVLSKGIVFSYLSVIFFMPILLVWLAPLLQKTRHRDWIPSIGKLTKYFHKARWILPVVLVVIASLSMIYANKASYLYGSKTATIEGGVVQVQTQNIEEVFGVHYPVVLLIPNNQIASEQIIVGQLYALDEVLGIEALVTVVDPSIPREWLPEEVKRPFVGTEYARMVLYLSMEEESEEMYELVDSIKSIIESQYETYYLVGVSTSTVDIKHTVTNDSILVMIISIGSIFLVIMLIFKSFLIPTLLIAVIQTSIWMNMAIAYMQNVQVMYIGYLVVMALQLGATIDYAVLLSNRYLEMRKTKDKIDAMKSALKKSTHPIILSAAVLSVAGFAEGIFSDIQAVQQIGLLLGRGALLSGAMVLIFLPSLLLLFDQILIKRSTIDNGIERNR